MTRKEILEFSPMMAEAKVQLQQQNHNAWIKTYRKMVADKQETYEFLKELVKSCEIEVMDIGGIDMKKTPEENIVKYFEREAEYLNEQVKYDLILKEEDIMAIAYKNAWTTAHTILALDEFTEKEPEKPKKKK